MSSAGWSWTLPVDRLFWDFEPPGRKNRTQTSGQGEHSLRVWILCRHITQKTRPCRLASEFTFRKWGIQLVGMRNDDLGGTSLVVKTRIDTSQPYVVGNGIGAEATPPSTGTLQK